MARYFINLIYPAIRYWRTTTIGSRSPVAVKLDY
nr:MAG TPA: hypothetical protein [Caudoviricetes sp.]